MYAVIFAINMQLLLEPRWTLHRKIITPAFYVKLLEKFVDIFEDAGDILIDQLQLLEETKSFNIYPYLEKCTLNTICGK